VSLKLEKSHLYKREHGSSVEHAKTAMQ